MNDEVDGVGRHSEQPSRFLHSALGGVWTKL
jgi:hypothetical protein